MRLGGNIKDLWATNRNHDINAFKKHIFHDHLNIYNKWELFLLARGLEIPKVRRNLPKKGKLLPFFKTQTFLVAIVPTTN
jgi:hypothetical protein